jgi:hypothetical protein
MFHKFEIMPIAIEAFTNQTIKHSYMAETLNSTYRNLERQPNEIFSYFGSA